MPRSGKSQEGDNALVQSFIAVRRALGLLALFLPPMLLLVAALTGMTPQSSISAYYYGAAGNVLVGTLCAIAVFLWTYLGYQSDDGLFPSDKLVSRVAAAAVLLVAFVPTGTDVAPTAQTCTFLECLVIRFTPVQPTFIHHIAASVFFLSLAVFCLVNFRRTGGIEISAEKRTKNRIYLICGWVILISIALLAWRGYQYAAATPEQQAAMAQGVTVFVLESVAVWAFAGAWLVKGEIHKILQPA